MNIVLIGSVSSSYCALDALIRGGVDVRGVLGLDEACAGRVSDYRSMRGLADRAGVPFQSFQRITEPGAEHFLREHPHDLLWVIGLSQLVPDRLVSLARYGGVGFHPTMLPRGRGRAPVAWTILLGERAAVNLFFLADQPDAGDIIIQREVPVMSDDYAEDLIARTNKVLAEVVMELAPAIKVGELPRTPQDHALATYYPRRTPDDGLVDWSHSTEAIYRLVRAAGRPYPGAFTYMRRHKVTIWRAQPASTEETAPHPPNAAPGTILCIRSPGTMHVQTGDGAIWLTETQVEGRSDAIDNHYAELFVPGARFATVTEGEHCQQ